MAITLHAVEMVMFGACAMSKNRFFGLAYNMVVEAASMALPNDQTMACPLGTYPCSPALWQQYS